MILIRNKALGRFVLGQFASVAGDGLYLIALIWWVKQTSNDNARVVLLSLCAVLPAVLFGILGGAIMDRYDQKRLMVGMDVLRAGLLIVVVGLAWAGALNYPMICVFTVGLSIASAFFRPGVGLALVDLVPRAQLPMANSANQTALALAGLFGPALGGLLMAYGGLLPAVIINALTFLISAALLQTLPLRQQPSKSRQHLSTEIAEGFRYLSKQPFLLVMLCAFCLINFVIAPLPIMLPALSQDVLHAGSSGYGLLEAVITGGALLGGILAGLVKPRYTGHTVVAQILLAGFCLVLIGYTLHLAVAAALLICVGAAFAMSSTLVAALFQTKVPREFLGRVFGIIGTASLVMRPVALLVLIPFVHTTASSPAKTFTFAGFILLGLGLAVFVLTTGLQRKVLQSARSPLDSAS